MRLIDSDEFEAALENTEYDISSAYEPDGYSHRLICKVLEETPTVDAVPVIRCRECKHMRRDNVGIFCKVWNGYNGCGVDGFCSYGEKRET